ncbi:MAG: RNA methyltransferase [Deltaproteobacteria bacterium]|jgi:putative N6-adenine-specific DNA methylase|nr:RNA methyltransferase [Deltaproteobacteria bacterium]
MATYSYFATAAKGLEEALATELLALGLQSIKVESGGVGFEGSRTDGYRCCLWLRTANRVLQQLSSFECPTVEALYSSTVDIAWEEHLTPEMTLAVDANLRDSRLNHSGYAALKTKDAIVDRLRQRFGKRPNIDTKNPDVRINLYIARNQAILSLDMAGTALHQRGYRQEQMVAPIRETLAAGIIQLTGWNDSTPFVDPMCGSGTLPIEAALYASKTAPGLLGSTAYSFQKWPCFQVKVWQEVLGNAQSALHKLPDRFINGADKDRQAVKIAQGNSRRLPFANAIAWHQCSFSRLKPPERRGTLVCNPPYGTRLGEQDKLVRFYRLIGDTLKQNWTGWTAWILSGNLALAKEVGLKPAKRIVLYNGPIECRLLKFEIF